MLRLLREPGTGRPAPLARLLALLVVLAMVGIAAPFLVHVANWVVDLL